MNDGAASSVVENFSTSGIGLGYAGSEEGKCETLIKPLAAPEAALAQLANPDSPLNPCISRVLALLEDDDATDIQDNLCTLVAYHNKAREFASILKEDSPGLNLNSSLQSLHFNPFLPQLIPSETNHRILPVLGKPAPNQVTGNLPFAMPSFGPPRMLARPPYPVPSKLLDEELHKKVPAKGRIASNMLNINVDREHRVANALKPRKDTHKVSGMLKGEGTYVDLNHLLLQCANAVAHDDTKTAMDVLLKVKKFASPHGDGAERMAYYFADALEVRLQGTGWQVYTGLARQQKASPKEIFKASWMYMLGSPIAKAFRFFVNQTIMGVAKGASILHIMEYQFTGFQYPSLFKALAERGGEPPQVRLIAGNVPHYSLTSSQMEILLKKLEQTGCQLKACAASFGVPFHFTPWVGKTGGFKMEDYVNPDRGPEEVLVILSVYPLRHINEDLLSPPEKRMQILQAVRSMNPEAFIRGFVTASYSTPFFCARFREALYHFECQYDILDTFVERESPDRLVFESEILGRAIMNLIACEEMEVVAKAQKYHQCYASMKTVGLEQVPLNQDLKCQVQNILRSWHKNYIVTEDLNYLLMGWKGRMLHAMAVRRGQKPSNKQK